MEFTATLHHGHNTLHGINNMSFTSLIYFIWNRKCLSYITKRFIELKLCSISVQY